MEEVVLGKVLVGVVRVQSPPVVDVEVEDAENKDEHDGGELGLKANNDHDASNQSQKTGNDSPETPVAAEDKANEEEDEQDTSSELEVHLPVLLVKLGETGRSKLLANPRVGKDHEQTAHDGKIAEEEVEVEDETVSEALQYNHAHEPTNAVFGELSCNDAHGAESHGEDVDNEEQMRYTVGD